jgi:hypothetical protein
MAQTTKARATKKQAAASRKQTPVARAAELSGEVLTSVENGQHAALGAIHRFVDTLDESLPSIGDHPSRRDKVIDAALDMADRLVTTQYEFLRSVLRSVDRGQPAGEQAKKRGTAKRPPVKAVAGKRPAVAKKRTKP